MAIANPTVGRVERNTPDEINDERMALNALPFDDERQDAGSTP